MFYTHGGLSVLSLGNDPLAAHIPGVVKPAQHTPKHAKAPLAISGSTMQPKQFGNVGSQVKQKFAGYNMPQRQLGEFGQKVKSNMEGRAGGYKHSAYTPKHANPDYDVSSELGASGKKKAAYIGKHSAFGLSQASYPSARGKVDNSAMPKKKKASSLNKHQFKFRTSKHAGKNAKILESLKAA